MLSCTFEENESGDRLPVDCCLFRITAAALSAAPSPRRPCICLSQHIRVRTGSTFPYITALARIAFSLLIPLSYSQIVFATYTRSALETYMGLDRSSRRVRAQRTPSSTPSPATRPKSLAIEKCMSDARPPKSLTPHRKHHKLLKDGSEVWSEDVEKVFVQGGSHALKILPRRADTDIAYPCQASKTIGSPLGPPTRAVVAGGEISSWSSTSRKTASSDPRSRLPATSRSCAICGEARQVCPCIGPSRLTPH